MKTTTKLGVGEHINDEVDIAFVGESGLGIIEVEGEEHGLDAGRLVFVPTGTRRSTRGVSEDFVYLTVHRRLGRSRSAVETEGTSVCRSDRGRRAKR